MFGTLPFGVAAFGAGNQPFADNSSYQSRMISFEAELDLQVAGNNPLTAIIGNGDRAVAFAAIVLPKRLIKG